MVECDRNYHLNDYREGGIIITKEKVSNLVIRIAEKAAKEAACSASPWFKYQPVESEKVRQWAISDNCSL